MSFISRSAQYLACGIAATLLACGCGAAAADQRQDAFDEWVAPQQGPGNQGHKRIAVLMHDQRNGGVVGVYRGLEAASQALGWELVASNGNDDPRTIRQQMRQAITGDIDGIVLLGIPATQIDDLIAKAGQWRIPVVGWHAASEPGSRDGLFANIAASPHEVAKRVVDYIVDHSRGPVGVVIIDDDTFPIARRKTSLLQAQFAQCKRCEVLATENIPISDARAIVPTATRSFNQRFGARWTHTVAINDIYFDHMNAPLAELRRRDIRNIAAGDGAALALTRISSGKSQQVATIAEPLDLHGWQAADELNRAFAGEAPSGLSTRPTLLDAALLQTQPASSDAHRRFYTASWRKPIAEGPDAPIRVVYPRPDRLSDRRIDYPIELLELALRESGAKFVLSPSRSSMAQGRAFAEMEAGNTINVVWSMTSAEREARYRAIRIPIDKGLYGWRIPLVRRESLPHFAAIRSIDELKQVTAGQGHDWPDTQILRGNGFIVTTSIDGNLFKMLAAQRFDWFPRALPEIWQEAANTAGDGLVVEPSLVLHYTTALYYFVRADNAALASKIESGLEATIRSGAFERLFMEEHGDAIARAHLPERRVFELYNPTLPRGMPLQRKALWYVPGASEGGAKR